MNSEMLMETASNELETYPQALAYLDADETTDDDTIVNALYIVKVEANINNTEMARTAVNIIAEARNSTYLKEWLEGGNLSQPAMDFAEACRVLQIQDRTNIDPESLDIMVSSYCIDHPERELEFQRAASVLRQASTGSTGQGGANGGKNSSRKAEDWPVGIRNLGNTCYLNSLLQFYFTVKPFRDMLLAFDEYRMENTPDNMKSKKVGGRKVTAKEVDRSHQCEYHYRCVSA